VGVTKRQLYNSLRWPIYIFNLVRYNQIPPSYYLTIDHLKETRASYSSVSKDYTATETKTTTKLIDQIRNEMRKVAVQNFKTALCLSVAVTNIEIAAYKWLQSKQK